MVVELRGFMPHESLYCKLVDTILIEVSAKGVMEGMTGNRAFPSKPDFAGIDMSRKEKSINGPVIPVLFREEITSWSSTLKPVLWQ